MTERFRSLPAATLIGLAEALDGGRLDAPFTTIAVRRHVPGPEASAVAGELQDLSAMGMRPAHMAYVLRVLAAEREEVRRATECVELVWTGPELPGSSSRDTLVVVEELFAAARQSVLLAGFAVHRGKQVFRTLADRMDAEPGLSVRMFLNVEKPWGSAVPAGDLLLGFARSFVRDEWPGRRLPQVFYDPRALAEGTGPRAALHAKCIVVDGERALCTSANFTEAAQERNIEAGILVRDASIACALSSQFESLVVAGALRPLTWPPGP